MPVEITQSSIATVAKQPFDRLVYNDGQTNGKGNGLFCLPAEFDNVAFASAYVEENEVGPRQQKAPIEGSIYSAPGWSVWRYPDTIPDGVDDKGKLKVAKHPKAGQFHVVTSQNGKKYTLMFRDIEIQQQVNEIQGLVSRERLDVAIESGAVPGADGSLLGNDRLPREAAAERDAREDREIRGGPSNPVFHGGNVTKQPFRVSR